MRLARISISVVGLALGSLVVTGTGAGAVSPCAPGQPLGRPPGQPPGAPGPPPARPPQYPPGKCQLQLSAASTSPRASVTAAGDGYQARSVATMTVGSTAVGNVTTDDTGHFTQAFTVPAGTAPGQYDVRATGVGAGGSPYEQAATLQVVPLPLTGANSAATSSAAAGSTGALRSGAGLAAAPQGSLTDGLLLPGVSNVGGGIVAFPATGATFGKSVAAIQALGDTGSTGLVPASSPQVGGASVGTSTTSNGARVLLAGAGGLALVAVGGATVLAARRRKDV